MAQFDLKNANIYIRDGYPGTPGAALGAVNLMAGYAIGATTMTVDGFTTAVVTGDFFTVAGENASGFLTKHKITAHTETMSATTSITFTPALIGSVADNAVVTVQNHEARVKVGGGTFTYDEKVSRVYVKDRGKLDTVRNGDEEPVDVKLDFTWEFIKADSGKPATIEDILKKRGEASGWISTDPDPCAPYCVDIELEYTPPCTSEKPELISITQFRYETLNHDAKNGQVSISGKANVTEVQVSRV